jgi:hypothetical protein
MVCPVAFDLATIVGLPSLALIAVASPLSLSLLMDAWPSMVYLVDALPLSSLVSSLAHLLPRVTWPFAIADALSQWVSSLLPR